MLTLPLVSNNDNGCHYQNRLALLHRKPLEALICRERIAIIACDVQSFFRKRAVLMSSFYFPSQVVEHFSSVGPTRLVRVTVSVKGLNTLPPGTIMLSLPFWGMKCLCVMQLPRCSIKARQFKVKINCLYKTVPKQPSLNAMSPTGCTTAPLQWLPF